MLISSVLMNHISQIRFGNKQNCICQICNKGFRDTWKLKRHEKVHIKAGELPEPTYFSMQESVVNKVKETSDKHLIAYTWQESLFPVAALVSLTIPLLRRREAGNVYATWLPRVRHS